MAIGRQGRSGIFKGASRTPRQRQAAARPRSGLSALAGVTYSWNLVSDALTWGPGAAEALGLPAEDLPRTGRAFGQMIEPGSGTTRHAAIADSDGPGRTYDLRYALRFAPDRVVMVEDAGRWQPDDQDRPVFARGQLRVDPASSAQDLLSAPVRARSDLLCSIQNDINEALRHSHTCTLIVGSFDDADSLEDIARALRPMMRRHDRFAALGPGRFALTLTCCPASESLNAMKRLAGLLKAPPSLRLGAACAPDHTFQATKLLRFAEKALGKAAEDGKAAMLYHAGLSAPAPASEQAALDLIAALNDRRLILACRPLVEAQSRAPALTQACTALAGPKGRAIPLCSVPPLEEASSSLLVDGRMLELAADHLVRHPHARLVLPVAAATLRDAEWLPMLAAHLGARPGIESRLIVEIAESALTRARTIKGRLDAMKALGIGLALGGFGAGHVAPAQLQSLPFDLLKIDGAFIQPLRRSTDDRLYVRSLIDRAQRLGMATAAEWVDDEATARLLSAWGVDYLQGGLFGEPEAAPQPASLRQMARAARA